jgi:CheY-like chemotaxis protein
LPVDPINSYEVYFSCHLTQTILELKKKVLYADDDLDDKAWIIEAWQAMEHAPEIQFVENGRKAMEYLNDCLADMPGLIVLDLNMPEMDGRQTLQKLKSDERYAGIPVAVVTTSTSRMDVDVCRRLGADLFLTKPDNHSEWQTVVKKLMPLVS